MSQSLLHKPTITKEAMLGEEELQCEIMESREIRFEQPGSDSKGSIQKKF